MNYTKITIQLTPYDQTAADILTAQMGEIGFDSFVEIENGFEAYVPTDVFDESQMATLDPMIEGVGVRYEREEVPDQDWNEEWEKNYFSPVVIADKCLIRSPFHERTIDAEYEIIINPRMAFGTGHHETTSLMIRTILETNMVGKDVLDMGCGTGILSIMASMRGAAKVTGIDIDEWCYTNSLENLDLNNIANVSVSVGDATKLPQRETFDVVLANINRNILLRDMEHYVRALRKDGTLIMSGFYEEDVRLLRDKATELGLTMVGQKDDNEWNALKFEK